MTGRRLDPKEKEVSEDSRVVSGRANLGGTEANSFPHIGHDPRLAMFYPVVYWRKANIGGMTFGQAPVKIFGDIRLLY